MYQWYDRSQKHIRNSRSGRFHVQCYRDAFGVGVVYSVTIETVPFYWIKETREIIDWSAVKKRLVPNGDILKYHTNEILMNAYTSHALVTKRELVTERPPPDAANPPTNPFVTLIHALPALQKIWQLISKPGTLLDDLYRELGNVLAVLLKPLPPLVPTLRLSLFVWDA